MFRWRFVAGVIAGIALTCGVVIGVVALSNQKQEAAVPTATTSESPPAPTTPAPPPAIVKGTFDDRKAPEVVGSRLSLDVDTLDKNYGCRLHSYVTEGRKLGAFIDDCTFLTDQGYQAVLFFVILKNETNTVQAFNLRDFILTARDGSTFGAVNITRSANDLAVANFIPEDGKLLAHSRVDGWLTFDARTGGGPPIAAKLSYIDGKQTLTVVFEGEHVVGSAAA